MTTTWQHPDVPRLASGDVVGICAPAGPVRENDAFEQGVRLLYELGVQPLIPPGLAGRNSGGLAGSDRDRAGEFLALWRDPKVKAILAARGGWGSLRIAPLIARELAKAPIRKPVIGFSDITVLHQVIHRATGGVTWHGPVVTTLGRSDRETVELFAALLGGRYPDHLHLRHSTRLRPGSTSGRLIGGNLASMVHSLATPFEPAWEGGILLIEEVNEPFYRIDRMLTQLALSGRLKRVSGILLGEFLDCGDKEQVWERVLELTPDTVVVWGDVPAGHGSRNLPLPLGCQVILEKEGIVRFAGG